MSKIGEKEAARRAMREGAVKLGPSRDHAGQKPSVVFEGAPVEHRMVDRGYDGGGNWVRCSCGWEGGPFEGHEMLPSEKPIPLPHDAIEADVAKGLKLLEARRKRNREYQKRLREDARRERERKKEQGA